MYYYVYRITNKVVNKHYYGKRQSKLLPKDDLGIKYFSSSTDKEFVQDQKENPKNYKYKVVRICASSKEAVLMEIRLHTKFDVGKNIKFYNKAKQTSTGFDTTGVKYSKERRESCRNNFLGKKHTPASRAKIGAANKGNTWNIGRKHTPEAIEKMKNSAKTGKEHHNAVLVDIYKYDTNELVASEVVLSEWCREDRSLRSNLAATLRTNRAEPSTKYNPHQAKGFYAKYHTNA